ncbi:MAG: hypothetical protein R3D62_13095 [Xanthobacteraceae bacterium]
MSGTVLGFWDFFWIWWIVIVAGGGASYFSSRENARFEALEQQTAALAEELRQVRRGGSSSAG